MCLARDESSGTLAKRSSSAPTCPSKQLNVDKLILHDRNNIDGRKDIRYGCIFASGSNDSDERVAYGTGLENVSTESICVRGRLLSFSRRCERDGLLSELDHEVRFRSDERH